MTRLCMAMLLGALAASAPAHAQMDASGSDNDLIKKFIHEENGSTERVEGWLAPSGRFRVKIPSSFSLQEGNDPDTFTFTGEVASGAPVLLVFRRVPVVPGAAPAQLLLVTRDRFSQKLPGFTVLKQQQVKISGRPCAWMLARYDYQGNRGYPQVIENAYIVDGADGYIIHTEIAEALYNDAVSMLNDVYRTFRMIPAQADKPVASPAPKAEKKKKR